MRWLALGLLSQLLYAAAGDAKASPVSRVLTLLDELQTRAERDLEDDQQVYNRFACACEESTAKQAADITEGRTSLESLGRTILELKGSVETLVNEAKALQQEIADNKEAQETATQIRQKENAAFMVEKAEMEQALAALEKAMHVLQAAAPAQLVQNKAKTTLRRMASSTSAASLPEALLEAQQAAITAAQHSKVQVNIRQLSSLSALQEGDAYAPQSLTVQGILSDMYQTFASSLETRTREEAKLHKDFEDFIAIKKAALLTLQETLQKKEAAKVEAEFMLADADGDYQRVEAELKANSELFDATKSACKDRTEEWSVRKKQHDDLLAGINEAITILSSDDAKAIFDKTLSLLQVAAAPNSKTTTGEAVAKASAALKAHARTSQSLRLAGLAAKLQQQGKAVGHFGEVISAIEQVMEELRREQATDDQAKDDCTNGLHESEIAIQHYDWKVQTGNAELTKLAEAIKSKELDEAAVEQHLTDLNETMKNMEAQRVAENAAFLQEKEDDFKAIDLLGKAREALAKYFEEQGSSLRLSMLERGSQPLPDVNFTKSTARGVQSQGVVSLLAVIIEDLHAEINANIAAEHAAQLDYEKQVAVAQALKKELEARRVDLQDSIATLNSESDTVDAAVQANSQELGSWEKVQEDMKPHCDWVLEHDEDRRRKREIEMEGLVQAKEYLAGAQPAMAVTFLTKK